MSFDFILIFRCILFLKFLLRVVIKFVDWIIYIILEMIGFMLSYIKFLFK